MNLLAVIQFASFSRLQAISSAMNASSTSVEHQDGNFRRFRVAADNSIGVIRVGHRRLTATVQETSIDGFTVLVSPKIASKMKVGKPWMLEHEGARIEVHPQWFFNSPDGQVQIGLRRLRDLTPPPPIRASLLARMGGSRCADSSVSAVAFGGFVLFLFCLMALPGLGDRLGTSDRIQDGLYWLMGEANRAINGRL